MYAQLLALQGDPDAGSMELAARMLPILSSAIGEPAGAYPFGPCAVW
jgi:hypothetical protein